MQDNAIRIIEAAGEIVSMCDQLRYTNAEDAEYDIPYYCNRITEQAEAILFLAQGGAIK